MWQRDRNGNQTTLNYNGSGVLTGITDAAGRVLSISSNANGNVTQISDTTSVVSTYEYYPSTNRLKTVTYNDGSKYQFEYDTTTAPGKVLLTTVKDALNNILETHVYDSQGRATTSERHGGVESYTLAYNQNDPTYGAFTNVTDADGDVSKYFFTRQSATNLITRIDGACACGGSSQITTFEYDTNKSWLNLKKTTDALGRQTTYSYDNNRNVTSITDNLGTQTFSGYTSFGQFGSHTDRMGGITTNVYDTAGNLLTTTDPTTGGTPHTTTFTYTTPRKQLETITDARGKTTTLTYDAVGRLEQVTDANNKDTNFGYNARAQMTSVTNAENETTSFGYDLNNRLNNITYPDSNQVNAVYDLAGRLESVTDENGHATTYSYDEAYRLTSVMNAMGNSTSFGYDLMSNLTSQADALGNVTDYEYDGFDRLKKIIYPEASSGATRLEETFAYNTVGEITGHTDTGGRTTTYGYVYADSPKRRVITITDALSNATELTYNARMQMTKVKDARPSPTQEYIFTYDEIGRLKTQSPRVGTTPMSFVYDAVGNRTSRTDYNNHTTTYTYDNLNRLTGMSYTGAPSQYATYGYDDLSRLITAANQNGKIAFSYDNRGRLATETDVWGHVMGYGYDPAGNRTSLTLDSNTHTNYYYDEANNLIRLTDEEDGRFDFYYDSGNRLASMVRPNGVSTNYEYDGMDRLKRLKHKYGFFPDPPTILYDDQFSYNSANQIYQITGSAASALAKTFTYDAINRLKTVSNGETYNYDAVGNRTASHLSTSYTTGAFNRLTGTTSATANYTYNPNGSRTVKSGGGLPSSYGWDRENRLTSVTRLGLTAVNRYDALGRRVATTFSPTLVEEDPNPIRYTYEGLDVMYEDSDDWEGAVKYQNGLGIDNKLKQETGGSASYFLQNHLGSTVKLTNSSGSVTESNSYDSFGRPTNTSFSTRYQFTGREYNSFSGLQYSRARFYDPQIGRFISEDPIGFAGGDVNLYAYVRNNPLKFRDPTGLQDPQPIPYPTPPLNPVKVYRCCRALDNVFPIVDQLSFFFRPHCFIKTSHIERGMGPTDDGPMPLWPPGIPTAVRDHSGESVWWSAQCSSYPDVDEDCVERELPLGLPTGPWAAGNNCNTFANGVLERCRKE